MPRLLQLSWRFPMKWSVSEFLNLIELRSQSWCFVDVAAAAFSVPHNDAMLFYAVLQGRTEVVGVSGESCVLATGDILMVLSGEAHTVSSVGSPGRRRPKETRALGFLHEGEYVDVPARFRLGEGEPDAELLCSRLKVRWPGGKRSRAVPAMLVLRAQDVPVDMQKVCGTATAAGAVSVLTRMATLLFVYGFRSHPQCQAIFRQFNVHDPVLRARQFIEQHPFQRWTVDILAGKVGLGRSSFASRFTAEIGKSPMEFIAGERMRHAASFLEKTDMKISEVSERVGYRSEAAFTRRFSKSYGMTPGQLRRKRQSACPSQSALPTAGSM